MNRSCQNRLWLLLRVNTVRAAPAGFEIKIGLAGRKTPKGGQKKRAQREGHDGSAGCVKKLPKAGDATNGTAGL
jgi:hypothetical protein